MKANKYHLSRSFLDSRDSSVKRATKNTFFLYNIIHLEIHVTTPYNTVTAISANCDSVFVSKSLDDHLK